MDTETPREFVMFGAAHLGILLFLVMCAVVLLTFACRQAETPRVYRMGGALGLYLLVQEVADRMVRWLWIGEPFRNVLPLHLCGMSVLLTGVVLLRPVQSLFELVFYWGLVGATLAVITPDTPYAPPHFLFFTFFLSHGFVVIGVLYAAVGYGLQPRARSPWFALAMLNAYAVPVAVFNALFGTNYLYLCAKPAGGTLMDAFGPWPVYLLVIEGIGAVTFPLVYLLSRAVGKIPWCARTSAHKGGAGFSAEG